MARDISFALDNFSREARRKQAKLELAASERHSHSLFENMLEGYAHCRMLFRDGVAEEFVYLVVEQSLAGIYIIQDGRFAYVNPRFAEIFGYASASELIGVEPLSLVAEQDRGIVAENIRSCIESEVPRVSYGFTAARKDGSLIDVGVHGARATHRGRPAVIGLMQDVSEKRRAEEQIQRHIKQLEDSFMRTIEVATTLIEGLRVGGYIHDIGKIIVPAEILTKPGRLTAAVPRKGL